MAWIQKREGRPKPHRVKWRNPDGTEASRSFRWKDVAVKFRREVEGYEVRGERYSDDVEAGDTVDALFRARQAKRVAERFKRGTLKVEASRYLSHLAGTVGEMMVADVDLETVEKIRTGMLDADYSVAHIDKVLQLLGSILGRAVRLKLIAENPVMTLRAMDREKPRGVRRGDETMRYPLSWDETWAICEHMKEPHRSLVLAARATGARISEALGWRAGSIHLEARTVTFDTQVQRGDRQVITLKSQASAATVPMSDYAAAVFAEHLGRYPAVSDGLVFVNQVGRPIDYTNWLPRQWNPAASCVGIVDRYGEPLAPKPHDLRRGFGADLARAGTPLRKAQLLMRHADIATTIKLYSEVGVEDLRGALIEPAGLSAAAQERPNRPAGEVLGFPSTP